MRQSSRLLESNDPCEGCEAISQLRLELSLVLLQENELEKQLEEKQIDLERKEEKIHTVQSELDWSKDEIDQLKKALEKVTSEKVSTLREVEKLRNDNHSLKVTADLQRDIEEKQTKLSKSEDTNRNLEEKHEKQKKETISGLNKSKVMIETLYTKTRHSLDNSAKIQDEKNLLEEANRKLTDEIKTIKPLNGST